MSRQEVIVISCDSCGTDVSETDHEVVSFQAKGRVFNSDWCTSCFGKLMSQLGVEVDDLTCDCGFTAKTSTGLATHRTRKGH